MEAHVTKNVLDDRKESTFRKMEVVRATDTGGDQGDQLTTTVREQSQALSVFLSDMLNQIVLFTNPQDTVEFLSLCKQLTRSKGWGIIRKILKLSHDITATTYKDDRDLVLHAIRKYGFCCTDCFTSLEGGREQGLFCCTSLCNSCSDLKFRDYQYVDSVVRFYLCGTENITVRGKAFLVHPYWYSGSQFSFECEDMIKKYGNAFRIAEMIYEEKMFFSEHAPDQFRPRDDKAAAIGKMLDKSIQDTMHADETKDETKDEFALTEEKLAVSCSTASPNGNENEKENKGNFIPIRDDLENALDTIDDQDFSFSAIPDSRYDEEQEEQKQHSVADTLPEMISVDDEQASDKTLYSFKNLTKAEKDMVLSADWISKLPNSLVPIFDAIVQQQSSELLKFPVMRQPLGTMPLRDLVKNLHKKSTQSKSYETAEPQSSPALPAQE